MSLSDVISIVGLLVTVTGFYLAIKQLRNTASAAEATTTAIVAANRRMLLNHLLVLVPQLVTIEADIDEAIAIDNKPGAIRALVAFSHAAVQIASLLETEGESDYSSLISEMREAASKSTAAKSALVSGSKKPLVALLKIVAVDVASISSKCAGLTTVYQIKVA
ncbi:hypothetical protein AB0O95_06980 [Rhodoglobus sp. NPDC076762]